jgi:GGDEF domain-containing protein
MQKQIRVLKATIVALSEGSHEAVKAITRETDGLIAITQVESGEGPNDNSQTQQEEQAICDHIERYEVFCVLSAELSGLDEIERAWGVPAREQVLAEFRKRVDRCIAETKAVKHWNGTRVTVINNTAAILATQRLNKLRVMLAQPFCLVSAFGDAHLRLPVRTGMIEYCGEGADDCMRRIDESLCEDTLMPV